MIRIMLTTQATTTSAQTIRARERIAAASGAALLGAGLIFVLFVLPAEYAVDPFGTGAKLGLLPLGVTGRQIKVVEAESAQGAGQAPPVVPQPRVFNEETVVFTVAPHEFMEYKYRLEKGKALLYSWSSTIPVNYELHAEPDGAPRGYAQSYEKGRATSQASGTLTVPFSGIHGWYWENPSGQEVTVTLKSAGFYSVSHEFRKDTPVKNKIFNSE